MARILRHFLVFAGEDSVDDGRWSELGTTILKCGRKAGLLVQPHHHAYG